MAPVGLLIGLSIGWFIIVLTLIITASRRKSFKFTSTGNLQRKLKKDLTLDERKIVEEELARRGKFILP